MRQIVGDPGDAATSQGPAQESWHLSGSTILRDPAACKPPGGVFCCRPRHAVYAILILSARAPTHYRLWCSPLTV